ncbi:MAG: hypothetical protein AAFY60_08565, partial [Myxococcota bacterium]
MNANAVGNLYSRIQEAMVAAQGDPAKAHHEMQAIAASDELKAVHALDASEVAAQLDEFKAEDIDQMVIGALVGSLTQEQQAKLGVGTYGGATPTGTGPSMQAGAMFDPTLRGKVEQLFDQSRGATATDRLKSVTAEHETLIDDIRGAIQGHKEEIQNFVEARREVAAMNVEEREELLAKLGRGVEKQTAEVEKKQGRLAGATDENREQLQTNLDKAQARLNTLHEQREQLSMFHNQVDGGDAEKLLEQIGDTRDYDWILEKLDGAKDGKIDAGLEAVLAHYAGLHNEFEQTVVRENRVDATRAAIDALPAGLKQRVMQPQVDVEDFSQQIQKAFEKKTPEDTLAALQALRDVAPDQEHRKQLDELIGFVNEQLSNSRAGRQRHPLG